MTPGQILAAILVAILVSAAGTWEVQDWRLGKQLAEQAGLHKDELAQISDAASDQVQAERDKRLDTEKALAISDQQHTKELFDAKRNQALLRDRLATADVRLSVLLDAADSGSGCDVPATSGTGGVVHATRRAQLDPAHAQRVLTITGDGDEGLIALRACQAYAKKISEID